MRNAIIAIVILIVLGVGGWLIFGNNNKQTNSNTSTSNPPSSQSTANSSASKQNPVSTNMVTIQNLAFNPQSITVAKGTKVTWTNNDNTPHNVMADSGSGPASQTLQPGQSYSFTYNQTGTFAYHCSIHPEMTGTVTVTNSSSSGTSQPATNSNTSMPSAPY